MTWPADLSPETLLAAGYGLFLVLVAAGLQRLARFTYRRAGGTNTIGFRRHPHLNAWQCSEGYFLWLRELDRQKGLARFRAHPHTCNRCAVKCHCTDSDEGRELVQFLSPWPQTELGRFKLGLSLTLLVLAAMVLAVEAFRHHRRPELLVLGAAFAPAWFVMARTWRRLFGSEAVGTAEAPDSLGAVR
jgi:hypothetical protein